MSETETPKIEWPAACKFCGAGHGQRGNSLRWDWIEFSCGSEFGTEDGGAPDWDQDDECRIAELEAQIAALTQRLEQAEARIKEYRDKVEGLEMDKDKYRDKWLNTLYRATAAGYREKRLRDAVRKIKANSYLDDNVLNRHSFTTTGCEALREAFALIAQPSEGKETEDGK